MPLLTCRMHVCVACSSIQNTFATFWTLATHSNAFNTKMPCCCKKFSRNLLELSIRCNWQRKKICRWLQYCRYQLSVLCERKCNSFRIWTASVCSDWCKKYQKDRKTFFWWVEIGERNSFVGEYSRLVSFFFFKRNIGFYIIQIYLPSMLIVIISWVGKIKIGSIRV